MGYTLSWTGERILLWGGQKTGHPLCNELLGSYCEIGASFDPVTREWELLPTENGPGVRGYAASVWTGERWIVWGGDWFDPKDEFNFAVARADGASYDPKTKTWEQIPASDVVPALERVQALWTGSKLLVWGFVRPEGESLCEGCRSQGGLYDPETKTWAAMSLEGAPKDVRVPLVWTGKEVILWGEDTGGRHVGARYDPETDRWSPINLQGAPIARASHDAFWTGKEMIVIAGSHSDHGYVTSGGLYNPETDTWRVIAREGRPQATRGAWSGEELFMWGSSRCKTGASYDPKTDTWAATAEAPSDIAGRPAYVHWAGDALLVWGGWDHLFNYRDGAIYYPN